MPTSANKNYRYVYGPSEHRWRSCKNIQTDSDGVLHWKITRKTTKKGDNYRRQNSTSNLKAHFLVQKIKTEMLFPEAIDNIASFIIVIANKQAFQMSNKRYNTIIRRTF